jgi:hypothetical protein
MGTEGHYTTQPYYVMRILREGFAVDRMPRPTVKVADGPGLALGRRSVR